MWETGKRHCEIQCLERVFTQTKLSPISKSYVLAVGSEFKSCSDFDFAAEIIGSSSTLDPVVWNDVVDFANGESMTQNTFIYSTLIECPLYANVELLMVLADVPMQTCIGVMDEVAKLFGIPYGLHGDSFHHCARYGSWSSRKYHALRSGRVKVGSLSSQGYGRGKRLRGYCY